jgi:hypothetical protein
MSNRFESATPILMVVTGAAIVAGWLYASDPDTAAQLLATRSTVDWLALAGLLVAVIVGVSLAASAWSAGMQMLGGLLRFGAIAAIVVVLLLLLPKETQPAGLFDDAADTPAPPAREPLSPEPWQTALRSFQSALQATWGGLSERRGEPPFAREEAEAQAASPSPWYETP